MVWDPCSVLRGNLRCSTKAGSGTNSPSAQTSACPDPLLSALLGPARRVGRINAGAGSGGVALCASPPPQVRLIPEARLAGPSSADGGGVKGGSCLSEASSADPRRNRAAQVASYWGQTPISLRCFAPYPQGEPKARRIGALTPKTPRQSGRLFFAYFFLATQKKVSCRRATPGLLARTSSASHRKWVPN